MPYGSVLVVDEMETNLLIASNMLKRYDLDVDTALDGVRALKKVKEKSTYDVIFVQLKMASMDGIALAKALRESGYKQAVVVMCENQRNDQKKELLNNGFSAICDIPFNEESLNEILIKFITEKKSAKEIEIARQLDEEEKNQAAKNFVPLVPGARFSREIFEDFLESQRNVHTDMTQAIKISDFKKAHRLAHTMKGLALVVNEPNLSGISLKLEKILKTEQEPPQDLLQEFGDELAAVCKKIENIVW